MSDHSFREVALHQFESASNEAGDLADRISRCGHIGASNAEVVGLLKAWQAARCEAREAHERFLARNAGQRPTSFG